MDTSFQTFERFTDPGLAATVAEKLKENGIEIRIEGDGGPIDPIILPTQAVESVSLQIPADAFDQARAVLEAYYDEHLGEADPDYFLYSFTDAELRDVYAKPDEWGYYNFALAKKILADRGKPVK